MLLLILAGMLGYQPADAMQQVEYIRLSYKANKDAFVFGTFHFEYTKALSTSLSDAESEVFSKAVKEDGFYVFDGENARYELTTGPKELAAAIERIDERNRSAFIMAFRMLTDGKVTLWDNFDPPDQRNTELRHRPMIAPATTHFHRFFEFPLYLGDNGPRDYDLFADLTAIKDGKISLAELDMDSHIDDIKTCKFSFTWKDGRRTYWIDLNRGSVSLRILDHYNPNNLDILYIFGDLVHASNAGWLPRRRLHIIGQGAIVDRIVVKEVDTQHKPRPSDFQLDFPKPIGLDDDARKLVYPRRKTWSLLNLPGANSPGTKAFPKPPIPTPELPGEVESSSHWIIILPAAAMLLLMTGSVVVLRRRRSKLHEV